MSQAATNRTIPTARPGDPALARRLRSAARVRSQQSRVADGVSLVRRYVRTNRGGRMLLIHPRCENLIRELRFWRLHQAAPGVWDDEPEPNDNYRIAITATRSDSSRPIARDVPLTILA